MMETVRCRDAYEAQKLAGFARSEAGAPAPLAEVLDVIGEECVVALRDSSAHSVILADGENAALLADFVQSVHEGAHAITSAMAHGDAVTLEKR
ncbi:MAG: hypothetical protein OXU85_07755 [Thaumarchaeota archaeon]|nr:hypothetical protein [Nitrososphaerota archaeon]